MMTTGNGKVLTLPPWKTSTRQPRLATFPPLCGPSKRDYPLSYLSTRQMTTASPRSCGLHLEVVETLVKAEASVDVTNNMGSTAVMHAAYAGHADIVEVLHKTKKVDLCHRDGWD